MATRVLAGVAMGTQAVDRKAMLPLRAAMASNNAEARP